MPTFVEFDSPSGPIRIETKSAGTVTAVTSTQEGVVAKAERQLRDSLRTVAALANEFSATLASIEGCSSGEIEFGLEVSGKGTIYVVETAAQASFKVTLKFDLSTARDKR